MLFENGSNLVNSLNNVNDCCNKMKFFRNDQFFLAHGCSIGMSEKELRRSAKILPHSIKILRSNGTLLKRRPLLYDDIQYIKRMMIFTMPSRI